MLQPELYWVRGTEPARLALMPRPRGGNWLVDEAAGWQRASINTVVSLLERHEVRELELQAEEAVCQAIGIEFLQFPIADRSTPTPEARLLEFVRGLHDRIQRGDAIAIHCRVGIGRTGLLAGCLLHLLDVPGQDIFHILSRSWGFSMPDTSVQAEWVERFCQVIPARSTSTSNQRR